MNKKELNTLFINESRSLFFLAMSYVKDSDLAEDVIQSAFIKTWENKDKVNNPISFLRKSVINISINTIRNNNNRKQIEQTFIDRERVENITVEDFCDKNERIINALNKLPDDVQKTIVLKCIEGLKYNEIAEDLGLSIDGVKSRVKRGYKKIREDFILFLAIYLKNF